MNGCYRVIDETNFNVLGTFASQEEAVDYVAALLSVNDSGYLDELTIANDDGPLLFADSLGDALRNREAARSRTAASGRSNEGHGGYERSVEGVAAKGHPH